MPAIEPFEFATTSRILFGAGVSARLNELVRELGSRPFLVTGASRRFAERLDAVGQFSVSGEPTFDDVRAGVSAARECGADVVVSIGGGSALDTGKAVAMVLGNGGDPLDYAEIIGSGKSISRPSAPFIAVPTTAGSGSEATRNAVLLDPRSRAKVSLRSPRMLPRLAVVDPELAIGLPPAETAACGLDALTQLIEPFVSCRANPLVDALCRDGIPRIARALPRAFEKGADLEARAELALGALYSGIALANAGLGAVHGLAGAIGGEFRAPHGALCAALLPPVLERNLREIRRRGPSLEAWAMKFDEIARLICGHTEAMAPDAVTALNDLNRRFAIPRLSAYGIGPHNAPWLAEKALHTSSMKGNPVPLSAEALAEIIVSAC